LEYSGVLKTRKLLKNREAENAVAAEIAPNWNVSGTRRKSDFKKRTFGDTKELRAEGSRLNFLMCLSVYLFGLPGGR